MQLDIGTYTYGNNMDVMLLDTFSCSVNKKWLLQFVQREVLWSYFITLWMVYSRDIAVK